jgi:hypothetical protein
MRSRKDNGGHFLEEPGVSLHGNSCACLNNKSPLNYTFTMDSTTLYACKGCRGRARMPMPWLGRHPDRGVGTISKKASGVTEGLKGCRGRARTSTEQLAAAQISEGATLNNWWSTPVGLPVGGSALCSVYPVYPPKLQRRRVSAFTVAPASDSPPPRQEGMSAKDFITPQCKKSASVRKPLLTIQI